MQLRLEIAQCFVKFVFAGGGAGQIQLPAQCVGGLKQSHVVTQPCGLGRAGHASRPAANHGDLFGPGCYSVVEFSFAPGTRVHQTPRHTFRKDIIQAGLIAGDAGVDLICAPLSCLANEMRVGKHGACHRNQIRVAVGNNVFGHFRRVYPV